MKHIVFDFDCTLTARHLYHVLKNNTEKYREGCVAYDAGLINNIKTKQAIHEVFRRARELSGRFQACPDLFLTHSDTFGHIRMISDRKKIVNVFLNK